MSDFNLTVDDGGVVSAESTDHVVMRLRRYSNTASVPLARMAALGVRKGFPSRMRHLMDNAGKVSFSSTFYKIKRKSNFLQ